MAPSVGKHAETGIHIRATPHVEVQHSQGHQHAPPARTIPNRSSLDLLQQAQRSGRARMTTPPFYPKHGIGEYCPPKQDVRAEHEWVGLVDRLQRATPGEAGREGEPVVCTDGGCRVHPASMPPSPPFDAAEEAHPGGRGITILLQSAPRLTDAPGGYRAFYQSARSSFGEASLADAGTMLLATLGAIRRQLRLPFAPAVLVFDGLNCSTRTQMHWTVARAYVDKIAQVAALTAGTPAQLVVHRTWLHAAEAT